jgi:hypothetical protein
MIQQTASCAVCWVGRCRHTLLRSKNMSLMGCSCDCIRRHPIVNSRLCSDSTAGRGTGNNGGRCTTSLLAWWRMALCVPQSETSGFQPLGTCPHAKRLELGLLDHSMSMPFVKVTAGVWAFGRLRPVADRCARLFIASSVGTCLPGGDHCDGDCSSPSTLTPPFPMLPPPATARILTKLPATCSFL